MQLVKIKGAGFGVYRRSDERYVVKYRDDWGHTRQRTFSKAADANDFCRRAYRAWSGRRDAITVYSVRDLIDDYMAHRELEWTRKRIADNTIIRDRSAAIRIREFFGSTDATTLSRKGVRAWYDSMKTEGLSDSSVSGYATVLRGAYKWAMDDRGLDHLNSHPVAEVGVHDQRSGQVMPIDQIIAVCQSIPEVYRVFTEALAFTGFRIEELCRLDVTDWNPVRATLQGGVKTEAGKDRTVTIPDWLNRELRIMVGERTDGPLFLNTRGNRIVADAYRRRAWDRTVTALGIPEATPHWLRHSLATHLAAHGMSSYDLRTHFGWDSTRIADRYVHKGQGVRRVADTIESWKVDELKGAWAVFALEAADSIIQGL